MTHNEIQFISILVAVTAAICAWFAVKHIERRLGCETDWDLIALILRKVKLLP